MPFFADALVLGERGFGKLGGGLGAFPLQLVQLRLIRGGALAGTALLAFDQLLLFFEGGFGFLDGDVERFRFRHQFQNAVLGCANFVLQHTRFRAERRWYCSLVLAPSI